MKVGTLIGKRKVIKVISKFPILYSGWEMDNIGYLVKFEENGKVDMGFALSGHGIFQIVNDSKFIRSKLSEYDRVMRATGKALSDFNNWNNAWNG